MLIDDNKEFDLSFYIVYRTAFLVRSKCKDRDIKVQYFY